MIVLLGPTGSGKSDLALHLAIQFHGEIVNCDSVQLYRGMDVGTAKTPPSERHGIPHHLIDIIAPDQVFTAGEYMRIARETVREIAGRGATPIVVGGTGFYLRAMIEGIFQGPSRDESLRDRLMRRPERLHRLLQRLDSKAAARIHPNDTQKLVRAIEVCFLAKRKMTEMFRQPVSPIEGFRILKIGLDPDRALLAERLNQRTATMFRRGLIEEVKGLLARGYSEESKGLEAIGYREALEYIRGVSSADEVIERAQAATRQYAKRQRTWFRREPGVHWLYDFGNRPETKTAATVLVREFLSGESGANRPTPE